MRMKFSFSPIFFSICICLFLYSCSNNNKQEEKNTEPSEIVEEDRILPFSTGPVNKLAIYLDPSYQNGMLRDSLLYYFEQPYLLTPIPTSVVDLEMKSFAAFADGTNKNANNIVVVNLSESSQISSFAKQQLGDEQINAALNGKNMALVRVKDVNAQPQQLFYLLTREYPNLGDKKTINQLQDYIQTVIEECLTLDNQRLASAMSRNRNLSVEDKIKEDFGVQMWIPRKYEVMMEEENMLWLLYEPASRELYSCILLYKSNAYDSKKLEDRALPLRADLGKYVTTNRDSTSMVTHVSSKPFPIQRELKINEKAVIETRGLWEIENDYLGGGFVNYTLENKRGETLSIDGFVYYSEDDFRRQMRDIDAIMSTVQID